MKHSTIRIDKFLADMGIGTRSEVKNYLKKGLITLNQAPVKDPSQKVSPDTDIVCFRGEHVRYTAYEYIMLHKPAGVLSATEDRKQKTVLDLITDACVKDLFPVGRLDKDTEGLLLITNDGSLAHRLLSPNKHIAKTYYAKIDGIVTNEDILLFQSGILLEQGFTTLPAILSVLSTDSLTGTSEIEVTIYEGKFHQVKRMFEAAGKKVIYLKRLSMGTLLLDPALQPGEYRHLTDSELDDLL
ncbi:MAG: pseudouridine synthase [bacterium]|nr:pseudouridine synthase [bacterium]